MLSYSSMHLYVATFVSTATILACQSMEPYTSITRDTVKWNENITAPKCLTLQMYQEDKCVCINKTVLGTFAECENGTARIMYTYCITLDESKGLYEIGSCIYNTANYQIGIYTLLPSNASNLNDHICGKYNREGCLCGKCKENTYPLAYSYSLKCLPCDNARLNVFLYILAAFGPLTVFFAFILCCNINVTTSKLGFVFFSQAITCPTLMRLIFISDLKLPKIVKNFFGVLINFYSIWNLDFFRFSYSICLKLSPIQVLTLDYSLAVYPLFLTVLIYATVELYTRDYILIVKICKPINKVLTSCRRHWNIKTSLIDVFATFLLLSMVKFLNVSFDLLIPVVTHHLDYTNGTNTYKENAMYFDPTIQLFSRDHQPFAILALLVLLIFVVFPTILLLLYPLSLFHSFMNHAPIQLQVLHTFVDKFQGIYKNGTETEGGRDYRYFAALFLLVRVLFFVIASFVDSSLVLVMISVLLYVYASMLVIIQPHKDSSRKQGVVDAVGIIILALIVTAINCANLASVKDPKKSGTFIIIAVILTFIPCAYFVLTIGYKLIVYGTNKFL